MREIKNAKISDTMLGVEDHGILTCWIYLDFEGSGQGFGGWSLDEPIWDATGKFLRRQGTAYGMQFIEGVLDAVGVESWEKLKGAVCRVDCEFTRAHRIGHFLKDKWFDPQELRNREHVERT